MFRPVWVQRRVLLNEVDLEIHRNFERRGWLPLLKVQHPPSVALIREFYSNLFVHSDISNIHYMKTWIRGEEYVITPEVVASALGVLLVQQPMYPNIEPPYLDDIMSLITSTTISWGIDPRVTSSELTELNHLFFRISCHSIWPISHVHTIPIERCMFLYAFTTNAPISFPTLLISSLVEVHRCSAKSHGLFFPVFIHRILLDLGLYDFPASELVHIIAPIGATFLRQRAAQLKVSSKRPYVKSSTGDASRAPPSSDPSAEAYVDPTVVAVPPSSTSSDSFLRAMLDTVLIVQASHGQLLLDVLNDVAALRAELAIARGSTPPASPSKES